MWLMEQPLTIICAGALLVAVLVGGLLQTGRYGLLYAAVAALLMTLGLVGLERVVITPREEVKASLHVIAQDLQRNDVAAVLGHISEHRPELRQEAKHKMDLVEMLDVDIKRNLKVELVQERGMELAEAKFSVTFRFRLRKGLSDESRPYPQYLTVRFRREEDGKWRVRSYEMTDPRAGIGM